MPISTEPNSAFETPADRGSVFERAWRDYFSLRMGGYTSLSEAWCVIPILWIVSFVVGIAGAAAGEGGVILVIGFTLLTMIPGIPMVNRRWRSIWGSSKTAWTIYLIAIPVMIIPILNLVALLAMLILMAFMFFVPARFPKAESENSDVKTVDQSTGNVGIRPTEKVRASESEDPVAAYRLQAPEKSRPAGPDASALSPLEISVREFDTLGLARNPMQASMMEELAWFKSRVTTVSGLVGRDRTDNDYWALLFGPDDSGKLGCIDSRSSVATVDDAKRELFGLFSEWEATGKTVFSHD